MAHPILSHSLWINSKVKSARAVLASFCSIPYGYDHNSSVHVSFASSRYPARCKLKLTSLYDSNTLRYTLLNFLLILDNNYFFAMQKLRNIQKEWKCYYFFHDICLFLKIYHKIRCTHWHFPCCRETFRYYYKII